MSRSRAQVIADRIKAALNGTPVEISDIRFEDTRDASFGPVKITMFNWKVADNDLTAEMTEREVVAILTLEDIYVSFHKTRRHEGERLITAAKPKSLGHPNYTFGNLKGFVRLWLIEVTGADKKAPKPKQSMFIKR